MTLPDADSLSTYGGPYANYGVGPVDPTTDLDANLFNKMACSVAMASRMVDRVEVAFQWNGTSAVLYEWEAVWKGKTPTTPTITRPTAGYFQIVLPSSVQDELGTFHALNLKSAHGWVEGNSAFLIQPNAYGSSIYVYAFTPAGVATDPVSKVIRVRAR